MFDLPVIGTVTQATESALCYRMTGHENLCRQRSTSLIIRFRCPVFCVDCEASATESPRTRQAATSNSEAMNRAWALMSRPPMFRTCPFLIIAIAS
jgi:hypothetical protein